LAGRSGDGQAFGTLQVLSLLVGIDEVSALSATAIAHGMDGQLVKPDWAPLTRAEVRALLRQFPGCEEPIEILNVSPRPFSAASVVATRSSRVFVKRHHRSVRDRDGLLEEHRFLAHLLAHGAAVPQVLANKTGETATEMGEWTYEVHEAPQGVDLYGEALSWTPFQTAEHARSAGQAMARMHLASEEFDAPPRKAQPLVASFTIFAAQDAGEAMDGYVNACPVLHGNAMVHGCCNDALDLLAPFHAELRPLLAALKPMWTHNDLHASNLLWGDAGDNAQVAAVIDFGLADRTNAVHDLAQAIERNIVEWLALERQDTEIRDQGSETVPLHLDHLIAMLEGYESVKKLSDEEAAALAPMTALCHAEFALSETEYFLGVLHSEEKARMACDGWLVGHARWFRDAAGNKLLGAIRQWADQRIRRNEKVLRP
jgi:Ser/Thr protein kinase RdoA (MazF antagonist)